MTLRPPRLYYMPPSRLRMCSAMIPMRLSANPALTIFTQTSCLLRGTSIRSRFTSITPLFWPIVGISFLDSPLTCSLKSKQGDWIKCECVFTVVYDVFIAATTLYKRDKRSDGMSPWKGADNVRTGASSADHPKTFRTAWSLGSTIPND